LSRKIIHALKTGFPPKARGNDSLVKWESYLIDDPNTTTLSSTNDSVLKTAESEDMHSRGHLSSFIL
jgi:hypothetical protein